MKCETCETNVTMPFNCKFCSQKFCDEHRLPEDHDCAGLAKIKEHGMSELKKGRAVRIVYSPHKKTKKDNPLQPIIDLVESNPNLYLGIFLLVILFTLLIL